MALGLGSIAFTGFNADGVDNLAFVALEEIPAGTVIWFQDNEWTGTGFNTGESAFSFTATAAIAAGTVVRLDGVSAEAPTSNLGTVTYADGTNRGLSNDNEIVYAFLGTSATEPTTFLTAVTNNSFAAGATLEGTGLVAGANALELGGGIDIGGYTGPRGSQASFADYAALLNNPANWATQNGSGDQSIDGTGPDAPFPTDAFSIGGTETQTLGFSTPAIAQAEGNGGETVFSFTVTRAGGTTGAVSFSGTLAAGTTDAADYAGGTLPTTFAGTIAAGATSATVTITVRGDTAVEADEAFQLTLTGATNAAGVTTSITAASATATATITNDDAAAPTLAAGAIAFTGFNADGNDDLAFVALDTIRAGTTIYFNDREWQGTAFNTGEGEVAFTAAADIRPGTVVTISNFGGTPTSTLGTLTGSSGLSASEEIVYAYIGAPNAPSRFLAAIANGGFAVDGGTLDGTGLVIGQTAIDLAGVSGAANPDIAAFTGARTGAASFADYAAIINNPANWTAQDGAGDQSNDGTGPDVPFDGAAFAIDTRQIGGITVYDQAASLAGSVTTPVASDDVVLVRIGAFTGSGTTAAARAESVSFDEGTGRIYVTNAAQQLIDVAQVNADGSTSALASISLATLPGYGGVNSVAVSNGIVAVAYQNATATQNGFVALYDTVNGGDPRVIEVGNLPDQITFSPDGTKILVANEGESISANSNPAGSVSIIDVSGGIAAAAVTNTISFASLTGSEALLRDRGLALFPGVAAGTDVEPEYITVSPDGTRAYVTLQEVNAVAVIDLTNPAADRPLAIQPLGAIDRNLAGNAFDGNDQNGISLGNADVLSLLQPDAISSFEVDGVTYFVTANEGDARVGGNVDEVRLSSNSYRLDPGAYPNAAELKAQIGRLNVLTNIGDTDGDGDYDQIHTFGGRSISIFRQEADGSITKVRETGGEFEAIIARDFPALFNSENLSGVDSRSDNKGPEPEGVTVGQVGDRLYAFVALERVGGVMVYDVTDPANATFVSYRPVTGDDFAPETIDFVGAGVSPTGEALVITANEVSGTTTLYRVVAQTEGADTIRGSDAGERFNGRGGDDLIEGLGGDDVLAGGAGNDTLDGGAGFDLVSYADATGPVNVRLDLRPIESGQGADRFIGIEGAIGSAFGDILYGNGLANALFGGAGDDVLNAGAGDDLLVGGAGRDAMTGGAGADVFRFDAVSDFAQGPSLDTIGDFRRAEGDRIDLSALNVSFIGTARFSAGGEGQVRYTAGNSSLVQIDANGDGVTDASFRLTGRVALDAADFIL